MSETIQVGLGDRGYLILFGGLALLENRVAWMRDGASPSCLRRLSPHRPSQ